jgi:hypothetical protein
MAWSVEEIEESWLGAPIGCLALDPQLVVDAFSRVESRLGQTWLQNAHAPNGVVGSGTIPTLRVARMGLHLSALDGVLRSEKLIKKIVQGDASAEAELEAIYLVRRVPDIEIDLEPPVSGGKVPDFRVREKGEDWIYVEVTFPDWSSATERARSVLTRVGELIFGIKDTFTLEVFLRREPTDEEENRILVTVPDFCSQQGRQQQELPDGLGLMFLNNSAPGLVITDDHGEGPRPRIGTAHAISGPNEPHRHIAVRMAFSDQRATQFLDTEAAQLPKDAPGLIMIRTQKAVGSINAWIPLLEKQFELQLHNHVSGICLVGGGNVPTPHGEASLPQIKVLTNPYATIELPNWLKKSLAEAGADFERVGRL